MTFFRHTILAMLCILVLVHEFYYGRSRVFGTIVLSRGARLRAIIALGHVCHNMQCTHFADLAVLLNY